MRNEKTNYLVGIDLGTTNCALSYVDLRETPKKEGKYEVHYLTIPQLVHEGSVENKNLLPSFLYLAGQYDLPEGSLALPWDENRKYAVGELARNRGAEVPQRLVSSAKSWLCHAGVDRKAPILPWASPEEVEKVSPLEAARRYLDHLREAWNYLMGQDDDKENFLENQQVFLTVPASFDAVARELTVEAAQMAGLENSVLLEEPQAAFYSWLYLNEQWRDTVKVGDLILVCDIGGGTTDLSLIAVSEEEGNLVLNRVAVGEHILLGGDNMDLALAVTLQNRMKEEGTLDLDTWQNRVLWQNCRMAKETILNDPDCQEYSITIPGRGSSLIGGTLTTQLNRQMVESVLLEGFFPECQAEDSPKMQRTLGLQEWGLPYASDAAISKHIARFLGSQTQALTQFPKLREMNTGKKFIHPTAILFNGGVLKAKLLQDRLVSILNQWITAEGGKPLTILQETDLDLAVAHGASSYGLARQGQGIRIRGGAARSYYLGIETSMPSVPGFAPPIKVLCVVPFGLEEGTEVEIPGQEFGLVVGESVEFRFFDSSTRRKDQIGDLIANWQEDIEEINSLETSLTLEGQEGTTVPVRLHAHLTEIGTLELWFVARDSENRWRLEFTIRKPYQEEK